MKTIAYKLIQGIKYLNSKKKIQHFNLKPDSINFIKDFNYNLCPNISVYVLKLTKYKAIINKNHNKNSKCLFKKIFI